MTKKHTYALYAAVPIGGKWKKLDHFPVAIAFDYCESEEEAIDDLRKDALDSLADMPGDLRSQSYMICDETADKILSVFTLEARLKEERI